MTGTSHGKPQDSARVDLVHEGEYWCRFLRCSPQALTEAVRAVGVGIREVREYLRN